MSDSKNTWFGDVRPGELIAIDDGRIKLRVEEKSGQRARIKLEFTAPTTVQRLEPAAASFARQGISK